MTTAVLDTNAVSYLWRGVHDGQYDETALQTAPF
jgi:hypothetical protein